MKKTFVQAAQSKGFMKKGGTFKPIPKKGTKAYNAIIRAMKR